MTGVRVVFFHPDGLGSWLPQGLLPKSGLADYPPVNLLRILS